MNLSLLDLLTATSTWYQELETSIHHGSSRLRSEQSQKGLISLAHKLDQNNFWSWKKSVLLTIRTLKLQDHLTFDKIPPQFEEIVDAEAESDSTSKTDGSAAESIITTKKAAKFGVKSLQESHKYLDWMQNDCALMTWLDASMTLTYNNKVVSCSSFAEAWENDSSHIHCLI
ncbi:hypothetical protein PIB30_032142 [Stylosanthes scabra]|uniref:Retrotransposon Copia-like N-terminal domain-containing protein n=1 Tax=Stylosanthes scabra TaxID=79078 RepID=A0ABU6XDZ8_9FABA|nr:hypothetical protein [Stylosanthes scabra]